MVDQFAPDILASDAWSQEDRPRFASGHRGRTIGARNALRSYPANRDRRLTSDGRAEANRFARDLRQELTKLDTVLGDTHRQIPQSPPPVLIVNGPGAVEGSLVE